MIFGQKRRRIVGGELLVLAEKLRVPIGLAKGLLENFYPILGCPGRKNEGRAANPKGTLQHDDFAFSVRFGKAFDLGQLAKLRMGVLSPLGVSMIA